MMHRPLIICVLSLVVYLHAAAVDKQCKPYENLEGHTMCVFKAEACSEGNVIIKRGLTSAEAKSVVKIHNDLRDKLEKGQIEKQPKAKKMLDITWDPELAKIAQRAADQCNFEHDEMRDVKRFSVGQNIYMSMSSEVSKNLKPNMTAASLAWWNEVYKPGFDPKKIKPFVFDEGAGHYTQMAWATTYKLGCGYVMFKDEEGTKSTKHIFCNYGPAGNMAEGEMYEVL